MQETQEMRVQALGWEDALEEEMTAHSRILAWKIPWREEPGGLSGALWGRSELDMTEYTAQDSLYVYNICLY